MKEHTGHKTLELLSQTESYNQWIYHQIQHYIGQHILEVGCGIGNMTDLFKNKEKIIAVDLDSKHIKRMGQRFKNYQNVQPRLLNITESNQKNMYDTVICLNVLEHIADDQKALLKMHKALRKGGKLVLLVPSIKFLYNKLDKDLEHYRRYNKTDLREKVEKTGFTITKIKYMNFSGIFGWYINGTVLGKSVLPTRQVLLYDKLVPLLEKMEKIISPPIGLSLILIAEK